MSEPVPDLVGLSVGFEMACTVVYQRETLIEGVPDDRIAYSGGVCMFRGNGTSCRKAPQVMETTYCNMGNAMLDGAGQIVPVDNGLATMSGGNVRVDVSKRRRHCVGGDVQRTMEG
jgi:hypothetical protein